MVLPSDQEACLLFAHISAPQSHSETDAGVTTSSARATDMQHTTLSSNPAIILFII
jgi:hypothetical protein